MPNVIGDTQTAASTALTGAGLTVGAVTNQSSGTVASGDVISEIPAAATSVAHGSAVALVISSGPPTYTVGGTLIGLGTGATVQVLNGTDAIPVSANGSFTLPSGFAGGGTYSVTAGTPTSAQVCTVQNGSGTTGTGAVSADGDLIVLADSHSTDDPSINVAVLRGSGVTPATFEGVYSVVEYGGTPNTSTFGKGITLFAYANGAYSVIVTKEGGGTITNSTDTGTYTVAADGSLMLTDSEGDLYNGAISADGNALVLASIASEQNPAIFVGVRQ